MGKPLAYFISWTTYGTWLPGDERGWVERGKPGIQEPDLQKKQDAVEKLLHLPVVLDQDQRQIAEETIRRHCEIRGWELRAINVRTNHVHVVVTAEMVPEKVLGQFKA